MKSKFLSISQRDFLHGLILTVGGTIAGAIYKSIQLNQFPCTWNDWKPIAFAGLSTGLLYIGKKLFNNSDGEFKREGNNL
jgi:hypothetical protein